MDRDPGGGVVRRRAGFTLIEMVIAVAVAALLVSGVYATLVATTRTAEADTKRAHAAGLRARALSILQSDLRGRTALKVEQSGDGAKLVLTTTSDGLSPHEIRRGLISVTYQAKEEGLLRSEPTAAGVIEVLLLAEPVRFGFLEKGAWTAKPSGDVQAVLVKVGDRDPGILIR